MTPDDDVPMLDLSDEVETLWPELTAAIHDVLRSTKFILGPNVKAFESEVAAFHGVAHALGVNSGTDALVIGLRALGVGPGDEVLVPSFTFFATTEAVSNVGAEPVFVDIEPDTFCLDAQDAEAKVTGRTKAIVPVHLFGHPADMDAITRLAEEHGLKILEDTAQAMGARYHGDLVGALGHSAAFSFFPSKTLGAYGDGGMLLTNDEQVLGAANMLRAHGSQKKYHNEILGYNSRLDELQAAILRVKLPRLEEANESRRRLAQRYNEAFRGLDGVVTPIEREGCHHVYHQYTIRVTDGRRDEVAASLKENGVSSMVYYPVPVHRLPVYGIELDLPVTDRACGEVLSLPIWPRLPEPLQDRVIAALRGAVKTPLERME